MILKIEDDCKVYECCSTTRPSSPSEDVVPGAGQLGEVLARLPEPEARHGEALQPHEDHVQQLGNARADRLRVH